MLIQYYGDFCFKITTKPGGRATEDVVIWTDPLTKGAGLRSPQGNPDVLIASHEDPKNPIDSKDGSIVLNMPGEYSVLGIGFQGYPSFRDSSAGSERGQNTVFTFESEDLHMVYLGALGHELSPDMLDKITNTDIPFLPVAGKDTLTTALAVDLVKKIEPKVIIPMHFAMSGLTLATVQPPKEFAQALGATSGETVAKLNLKKKDLEGKTMEVIFMERGS